MKVKIEVFLVKLVLSLFLVAFVISLSYLTVAHPYFVILPILMLGIVACLQSLYEGDKLEKRIK